VFKKIIKKIFTLSGISILAGFFIGAYFGSSTGIAFGGTATNGALIFGIIGAIILYLFVKAFIKRK
jgi:hypothetical protein